MSELNLPCPGLDVTFLTLIAISTKAYYYYDYCYSVITISTITTMFTFITTYAIITIITNMFFSLSLLLLHYHHYQYYHIIQHCAYFQYCNIFLHHYCITSSMLLHIITDDFILCYYYIIFTYAILNGWRSLWIQRLHDMFGQGGASNYKWVISQKKLVRYIPYFTNKNQFVKLEFFSQLSYHKSAINPIKPTFSYGFQTALRSVRPWDGRGHHWSQLLEATSSKLPGEQKAELFTALRRHGAKAPQQLATWEAKAWRCRGLRGPWEDMKKNTRENPWEK